LAFAEVHDCFTPTEMVLMEDLGFSERARRGVTFWTHFDLHAGFRQPGWRPQIVRSPGRASGLRMLFECWLQLRNELRQIVRSSPIDLWP